MVKNSYFKDITILYVEDDNSTSKKMESLLKKYFKKIIVSTDGLDGLETFKNESIDLIISDINMLNLSGLEMLEKIREFDKDIPIIFTTARNESSSIIKAIDLDVSDYIIKPIEFNKLIKKIDIICDKLNSKAYLKLLEQYKMVVDQKSIVMKFDLEKKVKYINDEFLNVTGYEFDELLGHYYDERLDSFYMEINHKTMWDYLNIEKKVWKGILEKEIKNGSKIIMDTSIVPIINLNNEIDEFILVSNDITEIKMYHQLLEFKIVEHESDLENKAYLLNEYKNSIDNSSLLIRFSKDLKIEYINLSLQNLLNESNIINSYFSSLLDEKENFDLEKEFQNESSFKKLLVLKGKDSKLYIDFSFSKIYNKDNELIEYIALGNDISEIINLYNEIEETQKDIIYSLGTVGEFRSKETGNHVKRVSEYAYLLAKKIGISEKEAKIIKSAAPMHDIGKIGIPDSILNKNGKLTNEEYEIMKNHSKIGYEMLSNSKRELLQASACIAYEHHEKWDGSGYPRGLKGEDIHIYGRIIAISDVFDALISKRCYKKAWEIEDVKKYFHDESGKQFDPFLTSTFLSSFDEFIEINNIYKD